MRIELRGTEPNKPHILHVALFDDKGGCVEVPVRKPHFDSLPKAKQLAYVQECAEYHCATGPGWEAARNARRTIWDAEDKAKEEERFVMRHNGFAPDGQVSVTVSHHGLIVTLVIPNNAAKAESNARAAFAKVEAQVRAERKNLEAFTVG